MLLFLFLRSSGIAAQTAPVNDNYKNAEKIIIADDGFALGTFQSSRIDITKATKEAGESIHLLQYFAGTDKKTVWFEFETHIARNINIELRQRDTLIPQDAVGITIYQSISKLQPPNLGEVNGNLTPLSKFGSTGNTCLTPGKYYVQVSAKANANAEIWLNIVVDHASPASYDQPKNAFEFGLLNDSRDISFDVGCLGIDNKSELMPALGKDYNQTAWFTFSTDNYSDIVAFAFNVGNKLSGPDTVQIGYRLYKGDAKNAFGQLKRVDSAVFKKACNPYCNLVGLKKYVCGIQPDTVYSIQLLFHKTAKHYIYIQAEEQGDKLSLSANPQKLPVSSHLGLFTNGGSKAFKDYFACNSLLADNLCGTVNPPLVKDTTYYGGNYYNVDTFDMSVWMTFEVTANGYFQIQNNLRICGSAYNQFAYYLYKGDVSKSCDLQLYWKRKNNNSFTAACIEPGIYSLQILGRSMKGNAQNLCYDMDLGRKVDLEFRFYYEKQQLPSKYYNPSQPEDLGDITSKLSTGVQSQTDYFGMPDDTVTIAGDKFFSRFHFRQFYLSKPTFLYIETQHSQGGRILYNGKVSDGVNTLTSIDYSIYGSPFIAASRPFRPTCTPLPAGWYTVVSFMEIGCGYTNPESDYLIFRTIESCSKKYNRPYKASYYGDVDWHTSPANPAETYKNHYLAEECFNCLPDTPFTGHTVGSCKEKLSQVAYYVFNLKQESYLKASVIFHANNGSGYGYGVYQLFKGDVRKDSLKFRDTSLLIAPCNNILEFCRLQPGLYTFVVMGNVSAKVTPVITADKVALSKYDHARNASDIGVIPPTNIENTSPTDIFYCTTGAYYTDPDTNSNYFYRFYQMKSSVPYPMQQNYKQDISYYARKNLWYTFVCAGTGEITVKSYSKTSGIARTNFTIYSSNEKYFGPYAKLVAAGKADSTNSQGLTFVARNDFDNTANFTKKGCDSIRYYIVVERPNDNTYHVGNAALQIGVKYNSTILDGIEADYCRNAAKVTLDKAGEKSVKALVNCHTRGESFGEDGSNMACLQADTMPYKTTWFKFTYTGTQRVDLSFRIEENTTAHLSQIRYRVLYGTCDAMTPGPCVENAYSYFTLDCMGPGDYFIQVVMPEDATGDVTLFAKAEPTTYPICKPIDLLSPSANFSFTGGCNNTPVKFINLSSAGKNISYAWDFGNGTKSSDKNPSVLFKPKQLYDTFMVILRVTNILNKKYDEITIPVVVFGGEIKLSLEEREFTIGCSDKVYLKASSNYPFGRYEWKPKQGLDNPHSPNPVFTHYGTDATYTVTLYAESCILTDTVHIYLRPEMLITGDTMLCHGSKGSLSATLGYMYYYWSNNEHTQTIEIDKPGKYWVQAYNNNSNGCWAKDTFIVKDGSAGIVDIGNDITICPEDSVVLSSKIPGKNPLWSTGDTTAQITVNAQGKYWLRMDDEFCSGYDTIEIFHKPVPTVNLADTLYLCGENDNIWIDIYKPGQKYLWSDGTESSKINIKAAEKYFVQVTENGCLSIDSIEIIRTMPPKLDIKDTVLCGAFGFNLDAGEWKSYLWQPANSTSRELFVHEYGRYILKIINNEGCEVTDTINIIESCAPKVWVPNAFTPANNDDVNNTFKPVVDDIYSLEMKIYNRWGELIFISKDANKGWDGTFKGKYCPMDIYIWTISYTSKHTNEYIHGTVNLLR